MTKDELLKLVTVLQAELDATNRQVEILSDAMAESRREVARLKAVQEPVAWLVYAKGSRKYFTLTFDTNKVPEIYIGGEALPLYTTPPAASECTRSHPHENMDAMCELRTEIARLTNENARLKAQTAPVQEPVGYFTVNDYDKWEQIDGTSGKPLYERPAAQRQWVGLSEEEILKLAYPIRWQEVDDFEADKTVNFAQMVEAKLKEKNT